MGSTPIRRRAHRRASAFFISGAASLAMILGTAPAVQADEPAGDIDVYVTFEGYNLGQGYYIEPIKVTVPEGTSAAEVTVDVLQDHGHDANHGGTPEPRGGFYLSGIAGFDAGEVNPPSYLTDQTDFEVGEEDGDGYLGEFDYSSMSGWMYTVDNVMAPVGASDWELGDGEVMRWQFSVHGWGLDLGVTSLDDWGAASYFTMADKSELIRTVADPDPATATAAEVQTGRDVAINPTATEVEVADAVDALLEVEEGITFTVTKGATVGLHQKGSKHFAAFTEFDLEKDETLSNEEYDVYAPATPLANGTYNVTATINGETDKVARVFSVTNATTDVDYTLELTPQDKRADTPLAIPGLGAGDSRNLYTNLDDTGVVDLEVGETFDLDTFRTVQGQNDRVSNYFIEPDFTFDTAGGSITTEPIGSEGRRQLRITATEPGVSVVKVGYGPLKYVAANGKVTDFNGIDEENTGLVVVNVGETDEPIDTGIDARNDLDTYYFDENVGSREFSFTPEEGTSVRVHDPLSVSDWGAGWTAYQADEDGEFTVDLLGGRNLIEFTKGGVVDHQVVHAKGVDITIENSTDPGEEFDEGDVAKLTLLGVEGGVEKLAGIYNPGWGSLPKLTYSDGTDEIVSNNGGQYTSVTTEYALEYTYTGEDAELNGHLAIGGMGAAWPYHREIPLEGKPPNLNAGPIGPYDVGSLPPVYAYDGQVTTTAATQPAPEVVETSLTASVPPFAYGQPGQLMVVVKAATGDETPTGTVSTLVAGETISADVMEGRATLDIPAKALDPGKTPLTVAFTGNERFAASETDTTAKVTKAAAVVKVKPRKKKVKVGKKAVFRVRVSVPSGDVSPTGTVRIRFAGKKVTAKVNRKGVARLKVKVKKKVKPGKKRVKAVYLGDRFVKKHVTKTGKVMKIRR